MHNAARLTALVFLLWIAPAGATNYRLYEGADWPCVQDDYRQRCPLDLSGLDPNYAGLPILGPVPRDTNVWEIPFGEFHRQMLPCDPNGDPTVVTLVATNCEGSKLEYDDNTGWLLSADCLPGLRWWLFHVQDLPGPYRLEMGRDVLMVAWVAYAHNDPPALAHLLQRRFMAFCKVGGLDGRERMEPAAQLWLTAHALYDENGKPAS